VDIRESEAVTLDHSGRHFATLRSAASASFRAASAMIVVVLAALLSAKLASLGAGEADLGSEPGIPAHEARAGPAEFRAISAIPDAVRHSRVIDTNVAAILASLGTSQTGRDAFLKACRFH
jgi:hypothetical protein